LVKPVTVVDATVEFVLAIAVVQLVPPSLEVSTMYPMTSLPPLFSGRVHTRTTAPFVGAATTDVGATGTPAGTTEPARLDAPIVTAFKALTRKLYNVPFVRPVAEYVVLVEAVSATITVHVLPALTERSMR
jgi:hypothetical protein